MPYSLVLQHESMNLAEAGMANSCSLKRLREL